MKTTLGLLTAASLLWSTSPQADAQLAASNVRAAQRPNTKLVDIDYDVTGITAPVIVTLKISSDGGTTWSVPATTLTGAVGNNVTPGNNLRITWDAGTDWNGQVSTQTKFRVSVTDTPAGMSLIPAGAFQMGDALDGLSDAPIRTVTLSAFYMGQKEVTKAEWDAVRTWGLDNGYTDLAAGDGKATDNPAQTISWWDVVKWCNARSQKEGLAPCYTVSGSVMKTGTTVPTVNWTANGYRLPTEAEWEKAARGGLSGKRFPWGDTISQSQANYYGSTSSSSYDLGPNDYNSIGSVGGTSPATSPVGSFAENGYGLYDMSGNVWEWCWDWYGTYASGAQTAPLGADSGSYRILRGGNWNGYAGYCRAAHRSYYSPTEANNFIGFRVVLSTVHTGEIFSTSETTNIDSRTLATNLRVTQRIGTKLVDVNYDVMNSNAFFHARFEVSVDNGASYFEPTSVVGAIGNSLTPGKNLNITWNAGEEWNNQFSNQVLIRISVTELPTGMSLIPAGAFQMGDALDGLNDAPIRTVTLSAFYMGKKELTKVEWDEVRIWGLENGYTDLSAGSEKASNHPVQRISWFDMVKWCNARSEKEGFTPCYTVSGSVMKTGSTAPECNWSATGYRLPTEAEWEKAARGGLSGKRFTWGDTISHSQANFNNTGGETYTRGTIYYHPTYYTDSTPYTSPVGSFAENGYGLYDMSGNVWEWCWDIYGTYDSGTLTDPRGAISGAYRVLRGGCWNNKAAYCYAASRYYFYTPTRTYDSIGFRLARISDSLDTYTTTSTTSNLETRDQLMLAGLESQNGTITGSGSFAPGSSATLTAVPSPGYVFTAWTGDASGTTNPLTITMDANKTIGATFSPDLADGDSDGLTNFDELVTYGTDPAMTDTDGDGLSDAWEVGRGRFSIVARAESFTWDQARADARSKGGDLASLPDQNRLNRAMESLPANPLDDYVGLWIGASDAAIDGTWTWVNGEAFLFQQWATGRPSTAVGNTLDFAEIAGGSGAGEIGKWYDRTGTTVRDGYLLEMGYTTSPTVADADDDGLNDGAEQTAGTSPFLADTDGDGLSDSQEVLLTHTNPLKADSDDDGIPDAADDQDGDGLTNLAELTQYGTDPLKADTDDDGLADNVELAYAGSFYSIVTGTFNHAQAVADATSKRGRLAVFTDPNDFSRLAQRARLSVTGDLWLGLSDATTEGTWLWDTGATPGYQRWVNGQPDGNTSENHAVLAATTSQWADAAADFPAAGYLIERPGLDPLNPDTDGDGLNDGAESATHHTNPQWDDSDSDGLTDGAEVNTHHSNPNSDDTDSDGLSDRVEVEVHQSNPSVADTDGDGFDDLFEVNTGFSPTSTSSTPDAVSGIATAVKFHFNAANGVSYRIEQSTDLQTWTVLETGIVGTGGVVKRFYEIEGQPKRYFRVRRE